MDPRPYTPPREAHGNEEYRKPCHRCGRRLHYWRKNREQAWHGAEMLETDGVVYLKCKCGNFVRTRFKPMSAYLPEE